jgi:hypothetical protein
MSRLNVIPIVEGHGEQKSAIRTVVRRVWTEILGGEYVNVLRPIREPRSKLVTREGLVKAVQLADIKLRELDSDDRSMVLVLFDADEDLPCVLAPRLIETICEECAHLDVAVVLPKPEFETWFAAAAESLTSYFDLEITAPSPDPEAMGQRKGAVRRWMHRVYSETIDQVRLTEAMDVKLCRSRSPSFDKLCRELAKRL